MRISDWSSDVCSSDLDAQGRPLAADDAKIDALLEREVRVPEATAVEARRFYDRHRERFASEPLVEAEHILFSANPADEFAYSLAVGDARRSEEHTSELQSLMRISYAVFCLKNKNIHYKNTQMKY